MRAALLVGPKELKLVEDWPEPELSPESVIVEMTGLGICGSDLAVWSGQRPPDSFPWIIGHEATGRIVAVGDAVQGRAVGERVVIEPNYPCGVCSSCRRGRTSTCVNRLAVGINTPGLLRERAAVPAGFAWPAPAAISDEDLVCVEPVAVAHSAVQTSGLAAGGDCLVVGAGAQGLFVCQLALGMGADVSVIEPQPARLALAQELGARTALPDAEFPLVFETSGSSGGVLSALRLVEPGGTVILIGIPHTEIPVPIASLVRRQVHVIGSIIYDHPSGFERTLDLLSARETRPGTILGEPFGLGSAQEAMSSAGSFAGKSWISFG
ncbi:MAG: alcohol dehydrogenase catalytic domain-containing protein [Solirubrobacterales bacterium]|nr:alcohol dehydrogenase catalytic domain-containing protein [Solirubrobacterales bacterium]